MHLRLRHVAAIASGVVLLLTTVPASASSRDVTKLPTFSIVNVGALHGGTDAYGYGINNAGEVTGRSAVVSGSGKNMTITTHAFIYEHGNLTDLGQPHGSQASLGFAINGAGQVAAVGIHQGREAPFLISGTKHDWTPLTLAGKSSSYALAYGINSSARLCGSVEGRGAAEWIKTSKGYAVKWLTGSTSAVATGIDSRDNVVGYTSTDTGAKGPATLWLGGEKAIALSGPTSKGVEANGIADSSASRLLVAGQSLLSNGQASGVVWTVTKIASKWKVVRTMLPTPKGYNSSFASSIDAKGWAVGYATKNSTSVAVIWFNGTAHVLRGLLKKGTGWSLMRAAAINAAGQVTGWGVIKGELRPYLLTPSK